MPTIKRHVPRPVRESPGAFKPIPNKPFLYGMAGLAFLVVVVVVWNVRKSETSSAASGVEDVVARVHELAYVSSEEAPTIATINDAERLRLQNANYYRDAENGDKLLIWNDLVVLYSVSRDRILALQPIMASVETQATSTESAAQTEAESPLIQVRNGSGTPGKAREVSTRLSGESFRLLDPTNAAKTYAMSIILVAPGKSFPQTIAKLQQLTGAVVGTAEGEEFDSVDIILIVGADAQ